MVKAIEPAKSRDLIVSRLHSDIIGPREGPTELIDERPSARYLTGMLHPQMSEFSDEEDETVEEENGGTAGGAEDDQQQQAVSLFRSFKPATCGISFSVRSTSTEDA